MLETDNDESMMDDTQGDKKRMKQKTKENLDISEKDGNIVNNTNNVVNQNIKIKAEKVIDYSKIVTNYDGMDLKMIEPEITKTKEN